jgi:hypothetical protein
VAPTGSLASVCPARAKGKTAAADRSNHRVRDLSFGDRLEAFAHVFFLSTVWVFRESRETCGHEMQATMIKAPMAAPSASCHVSVWDNAMNSRRTAQATTPSGSAGVPLEKTRRPDSLQNS